MLITQGFFICPRVLRTLAYHNEEVKQVDIIQAQDIFLINRRARNLSKSTIFWYKITTDKFILHCEKNNKKNIEEIKSHNIEEFLISFKREVCDRTLKDNFVALRTFFIFLFEEEYIQRNPMRNMRQPKVEQKVMRTFDKPEIEKMLKFFDRNDFLGLRNFLIMAMLFSTGMRKAELLGIKIQDVNITIDMIKVRGKGNKERFVPISRTLRKILMQYTQEREEFLDDAYCEYLIVSRRKKQLTNSGVTILFHNLKESLNMQGERVSAHTWRHTFAKTFLLNGGDIFSLQKILGHSDIAVTRRYIALNDKEVKLQHAKFNPLDNKEWMI